jgi:AraC-like DNA-binding protein
MGYFDDLVIIDTCHQLIGYHVSPPIDPSYFSICLLNQGEMFIIRDGIKRHLKAPMLFWTSSGHVYRFQSAARYTRENIWLTFDGSRSQRIREALDKLQTSGYLPLANALDFVRIFQRIINLHKNGELIARHHIVVLTEELISLIHDEAFCKLDKNRDYAPVLAVAETIRRNPIEIYDFQQISRDNGISYDSFRKKFKLCLGQPPHDFLLACRMNRAAELLKDEKYTITEVADRCGFSELSSFSRMFKRKSGLYPGKYRKLMRHPH